MELERETFLSGRKRETADEQMDEGGNRHDHLKLLTEPRKIILNKNFIHSYKFFF